MERRHDVPHGIPAPHSSPVSRADVQAVLQVLQDEDVDYDTIAAALEGRPGIASLLQRLASSIGLGAGQPVRSMRHALAILGLQRIRSTVASLSRGAEDRERVAS